ncbi:putative armadillo-like helical, pumilio domain-containing protein [Helianthus annuus]|nr:putative armadillo-like helical, pumilio domain-containing protein [Helianthus annuus]
MREQFDRMFIGQNPTNPFAPSSSTVNGGTLVQDHLYSHQQPLVNTTNGFPFMNKEQRRLPVAMASHHLGANPVRSILDYSDRFPALSPELCEFYHPDQLHCVGNIHPAAAGFDNQSSYGFLETLNDRNLEFNFNRLNLSSPNHHPQPLLASTPPIPSFLNSPVPTPVNRNNIRCQDACCNPHGARRDNRVLSSRNFGNVLDVPNPISSRLLDQSRQQPKRAKFPASLKELRGKICMVAKDQEGCQFLQTKCEGGKPEDIEMIFNEIKDHIFELMTDASMNYLAQKLFKVCNERQMTHIVVSVISDDNNLTNICLNSHGYGTRAMQKLIELLKSAEDRSLMVSALRRITLTLTKNTNGHHVIQHCLKSFNVDEVQPILNVVADNCLDIATDKSGCCVLQLCVLHADEASKERLMTEIIENALDLSEHPYGFVCPSSFCDYRVIPEVTAHILKKLAGNFVNLAMNKYASNVVEKCVKDAPDDLSTPIIREIINSPNFLGLIQHPFGNYVAQSALHIAKVWSQVIKIDKTLIPL